MLRHIAKRAQVVRFVRTPASQPDAINAPSNELDDELFVESITQETTVLKAPDFSKEPNASLPPLAKENLLKLYLKEQQKLQN